MITIQKFNAVSDEILNILVDHYVAAGTYDTAFMNGSTNSRLHLIGVVQQ